MLKIIILIVGFSVAMVPQRVCPMQPKEEVKNNTEKQLRSKIRSIYSWWLLAIGCEELCKELAPYLGNDKKMLGIGLEAIFCICDDKLKMALQKESKQKRLFSDSGFIPSLCWHDLQIYYYVLFQYYFVAHGFLTLKKANVKFERYLFWLLNSGRYRAHKKEKLKFDVTNFINKKIFDVNKSAMLESIAWIYKRWLLRIEYSEFYNETAEKLKLSNDDQKNNPSEILKLCEKAVNKILPENKINFDDLYTVKILCLNDLRVCFCALLAYYGIVRGDVSVEKAEEIFGVYCNRIEAKWPLKDEARPSKTELLSNVVVDSYINKDLLFGFEIDVDNCEKNKSSLKYFSDESDDDEEE